MSPGRDDLPGGHWEYYVASEKLMRRIWVPDQPKSPPSLTGTGTGDRPIPGGILGCLGRGLLGCVASIVVLFALLYIFLFIVVQIGIFLLGK
ncbi:hypothetical protein ABZ307_42395 [Streptomyces griseorubiginosus]|uniref:hypothetical protein n=1 Tax=Streptomyces griseorubiginosus TaxID=67304 RepID=UPI0033A8DE10